MDGLTYCTHKLFNSPSHDSFVSLFSSDFMNGTKYKKLMSRLQEMCEYYERPCLIVENNPQKGQIKKNGPRAM